MFLFKYKYILKGQSSKPFFWVEGKNVFVIGPFIGSPSISDFGLYSGRYSYSKSTPWYCLLRRVDALRIIYYAE